MIIAPDSDIILLKAPFEIDNNNQLTFASSTAQFNYFNSLPKLELENATYQRKEGVVRYPGVFDELITYNYCMYRNNGYSNKWFYAYIRDINFVNNGMTELTLETDIFQSWQFDIIYRRSFVEREHVNNDSLYRYLLDEGLNFGEYINGYISNFTFGEAKLVMLSTVSPITGNDESGGTYNGVYSAGKYYTFRDNGLNIGLNRIASAGKSDGIIGVFLTPSWLVNYDNLTYNSDGIASIPNSSEAKQENGFSIPLTAELIDGYQPKNNKLYSYPYRAYVIDNNNGNAVELRLEDFNSNKDTGDIVVFGALTPGCSIRAIPLFYKTKFQDPISSSSYNNEYGITCGKFPICSFPVDMYTNWLTQNSVNQTLNYVSSGLQVAGGLISLGTGNPVGGASMLSGGAMGIARTMGENYRASLIPDQAMGNTNSGDVMYSTNRLCFTGYFKTIKYEFAKRIDDFFSMYGYKINELKIPNITGRPNWNYVKTIDCNILGEIPQQDLQKLKSIFNNGVTFWHNPNTFLDYSQNNK